MARNPALLSEDVLSEAGEGIRYHSFSAINTYAAICSLQYRYRYVDRLPKERVSAALVFGIAVNDALRSIDLDLAKGHAPNVSAACEVLRHSLEVAYARHDLPVVSTHDETLEGLFEKGRNLVEYYVKVLPADEVPIELPRRFEIPLFTEEGEALPRPLVGEVDRWVKDSAGHIGIVDWKTSAARWSPDKLAKDDQATTYLMAGPSVLGQKPAFFRYDLLLKTKEPKVERYYVERGERDFKRFTKKVAVTDRAIRSGVFLPNDTSFACPTCAYRGACEKWQG